MLGRLEAVVGVAAGSTLSGVVVLVVLAGLGVFGTTANLGSGETAAASSLYGGDSGASAATSGGGGYSDDGYGYGPADSSEVSGRVYAIGQGWHDGVAIDYVDFQAETVLAEDGSVLVAPIWVFITGFDGEGRPQILRGRTVVDVVPGDAGYSDLWDVQFVTVPEDYDGGIHSLAELEASGLPISPSGMLVNCPIVPEGSSVETGHDLRPGWYRGEPMFYYDVGLSPTIAGDAYVMVAGLDESGEPTEVVGTPVLSGDLEGDFWRLSYVMVDGEFGANSIRSLAELEASGLAVTSTEVLLNWPVIEASSTR